LIFATNDFSNYKRRFLGAREWSRIKNEQKKLPHIFLSAIFAIYLLSTQNRDQGSISPTFYVQLLRQQSCASKVQT
jgi:hypothetical protein